MVVETAWSSRVPWKNSVNTASCGLARGCERTMRRGTQPPSWRRRSVRYVTSGLSGPGW
jgi:hypothetical protein